MVDIATKWLSFPIEYNNYSRKICKDDDDDDENSFIKSKNINGNIIGFLNYFKSEHIKTITKLATFDDTIKMSCIEDSIIFKSYITRCTPTKARHLPSEYIGTVNIWVKAESRKEISDDEDDL
jgi:hypothetical protein